MIRLPRHAPEYAIEAGCLGVFLVSACAFTVLLEHPASPVRAALPDPLVRRALMGLAMAATAAALIYSPAGGRSGAHMNPAVTLAWTRLGRVAPRDTAGYIGAQFAGGLAGMAIAWLLFGHLLADPAVHWVATRPGPAGRLVAFGAEFLMTLVLMLVVLVASNHPRWTRRTGMLAAGLVALYITVEAPLSGMSMNPARSFGPAVFAGDLSAMWLYLVAPVLGTLTAAELYVRRRGAEAVFCAKVHHGDGGCIFNCRFHDLGRVEQVGRVGPAGQAGDLAERVEAGLP